MDEPEQTLSEFYREVLGRGFDAGDGIRAVFERAQRKYPMKIARRNWARIEQACDTLAREWNKAAQEKSESENSGRAQLAGCVVLCATITTIAVVVATMFWIGMGGI